METILIFTDAATSSKMNMAVGAFVYVDQTFMQNHAECSMKDLSAKLDDMIIYKKYVSIKSTWSEIKTVIDALHFLHDKVKPIQKIEIYTDCQSFCDLLGRRKEKLQKNHFITKKGNILQHANLYKELFNIADKFQIQTFKIKGHHSMSSHLTLQEKIFSILDKFSRKKLRLLLTD